MIGTGKDGCKHGVCNSTPEQGGGGKGRGSATGLFGQLLFLDLERVMSHDVIAVLRADAETATIPVAFLTAKAEKLDLCAGMNVGAEFKSAILWSVKHFKTSQEKTPNE
jgi:hypothetical protein